MPEATKSAKSWTPGMRFEGVMATGRTLELAELVVGLDRVHAADQRAAHLAFGRDDRLGPRHRFLDQTPRHDDDAVAIAENVVPGRDGYLADDDRLAVAIRHPALDDIGRRQECAEDRKALFQHEVGIARAAVDDVAQHAAGLQRL